jgi:hypothetical protein
MVSPIASILHRIQKKSGKCHYGNIFPYIFLLWQIQWALRLFDGARFDGMGINHRSANIGVSQQFLNGADGVIGPLAVALF